MELKSKILTPYKGYSIEKSWEEYGGVKMNTVYTAYDLKGYLFDSSSKLEDLKKKIDDYCKLD